MNPASLPPRLRCTAVLVLLILLPGVGHSQEWRLLGITGQQQDETPDGLGDFQYPDHTLYEIDPLTGAITKLFRTTWVNDSQAIGYCPDDGLLYHTSGSHSYSNNPLRAGHQQGGPDILGIGYQDSQYMEAIDVSTQAATAIFNAAPCPNPDPSLPCFGLPAPRPDWLFPAEPRNSSQTDPSFGARGLNEYTAARGLAWSPAEGIFYLSDDAGIFKVGRDGSCVFLARPTFFRDNAPNESKAIACVTTGGETSLLVGHRQGVGLDGLVMQIDPDTGEFVTEFALTYPDGGGDPVGAFGGLLGLVQHPVTGLLYGVRKTTDHFSRELVTIDLTTGATTLIGNLGMHIASIAFIAGPSIAPPVLLALEHDGADLTLRWSGGTPPYQLESSLTLEEDSWTGLGDATNETSATVPISASRLFFRVRGRE